MARAPRSGRIVTFGDRRRRVRAADDVEDPGLDGTRARTW